MKPCVWVIGAVLATLALADVPIDCSRTEVEGDWIFFRSTSDYDNTLNCTDHFISSSHVSSVPLKLAHPDVVIGPDGVLGHWTMVYNEGFEVRWGGYIYFSFFKYKSITDSTDTITFCGQTQDGTFHTHQGDYWGCFQGRRAKISDAQKEKKTVPDPIPGPVNAPDSTDYDLWVAGRNLMRDSSVTEASNQAEFVSIINAVQNTWEAREYPEDVMAVIDASLAQSKSIPREFNSRATISKMTSHRHRR